MAARPCSSRCAETPALAENQVLRQRADLPVPKVAGLREPPRGRIRGQRGLNERRDCRPIGVPGLVGSRFHCSVGWDMMHHDGIKRIDTRAVPGSYASACMAYDLPVGLAALLLS